MLWKMSASLRPIGNHPRYTQNTMSMRIANQNSGMLAPLIEKIRVK